MIPFIKVSRISAVVLASFCFRYSQRCTHQGDYCANLLDAEALRRANIICLVNTRPQLLKMLSQSSQSQQSSTRNWRARKRTDVHAPSNDIRFNPVSTTPTFALSCIRETSIRCSLLVVVYSSITQPSSVTRQQFVVRGEILATYIKSRKNDEYI